MVLHQKPFTHDVLILTFPSTYTSVFDSLSTGIPVRVKWSRTGEEREWVGYVSQVTKTVAYQQEKLMDIVCVGASFVLKERANRVFTEISIPDAVELIAKEHDLGFVGDFHEQIFPQLAMAGHSYWEWIVEQAKKIGYTVYLSGTTLHFRKLDSMIDQSMTSVPTLYFNAPKANGDLHLFNRTLNYFKITKGSYNESNASLRTKKVMGGVDPYQLEAVRGEASSEDVTTNVRTSNGNSLFTEYRSDRVVNSEAMSATLAKGSAELARLSIPAKAKGQGDPRMRPYQSVYIQGTGESTDGYWVIDEIKHTIISGDYNVDMTVLIDGFGALNESPARKNNSVSDKLVNITERIKTGTIQGDSRESKLKTYKAAIMPSDNGFITSPSRWVSTIPGRG
jgi:phage protein D